MRPDATKGWRAKGHFSNLFISCVAVVSVSFKPSGISARGHWAKRSKKSRSWGGRPSPPLLLFCSFLPNALARLIPFGLKETETTTTQANLFTVVNFIPYQKQIIVSTPPPKQHPSFFAKLYLYLYSCIVVLLDIVNTTVRFAHF